MAMEAHGLLADLLLSKEELPSGTHQKLRRIKDILAPKIDKMLARPRVQIGMCSRMYVCAFSCIYMYVCVFLMYVCVYFCL